MPRIKVDFENDAETWWNAAATWEPIADPEAQEAWLSLFRNGAEEVVVSDRVLVILRAVSEDIPGWADGPAYAPHPWVVLPDDIRVELDTPMGPLVLVQTHDGAGGHLARIEQDGEPVWLLRRGRWSRP